MFIILITFFVLSFSRKIGMMWFSTSSTVSHMTSIFAASALFLPYRPGNKNKDHYKHWLSMDVQWTQKLLREKLGGGGGGRGHSHTNVLPTRVHQLLKWTLNGVSHHVTFAPLKMTPHLENINPKWRILIVMALKMISRVGSLENHSIPAPCRPKYTISYAIYISGLNENDKWLSWMLIIWI